MFIVTLESLHLLHKHGNVQLYTESKIANLPRAIIQTDPFTFECYSAFIEIMAKVSQWLEIYKCNLNRESVF